MRNIFLFFCLCWVHIQCFYLPGVAPRDYQPGESVDLKTNALDSVHNIPFSYYSLNFCRPPKITQVNENLGEILMGDRILNTPYEIYHKLNSHCQILCKTTNYNDDLKLWSQRIFEDYRVHWMIDNLPAHVSTLDLSKPAADDDHEQQFLVEKGFPLGFVAKEGDLLTNPTLRSGGVYINNHVELIISFHGAALGSRIVGFEIQPYSIRHKIDGEWKDADTKLSTCLRSQKQPQSGLR
jgi:transmembrane 9 superfamily protein 2/4